MSASDSRLNRRQWLVNTGLVAGSSVLAPRMLSALDITRNISRGMGGSYHEALLAMEREATEARRAAGPIRLCFNENPFGMSPKAKDAIMAGWSEHNRYDPPEEAGLTKAFAKHVGVDPSHVLVSQGSQEILSIAALAYAQSGADIVIPWPTFEGLPDYAETVGANVHRVPLDANLQHDLAAMDRHITNTTKLVFVCNPNNPTGTLADAQKLRDFVKSASKRCIVIVDEAYHDFIDDPNYKSMVDLATAGENVIVSRTASKVHGLAAVRIGFGIARPDIITKLHRLVTGQPNVFGLQAAMASVADTEYQTFVKTRNREGRELLTTTLKSLGKRVAPSQTNFVFFQAGLPAEKVQTAMLAKGFRIGRTFPPFTDWCRVSIGTPDEMKAFVAALPEALRA
jgi:histidinol-phosphate aminotransferase